jgi:signal peptidase I
MAINISDLWKNNRSLILVIFLMVIFRTTLADWNTVPTGSMKPTILEGDRIFVNKIAYDLNIPFTHISINHFDDPKRGDIVIFDSAIAEKRLVKRVIGLPGDTVSMENNVILLNGKPLDYKIIQQDQEKIIVQEKIHESAHHIRLNLGRINRASSFNAVTIPENQYLVLGDNRNNSADSRFIGLIPRNEIIGRARHVVMSLNYDNYYLPRTHRFLQKL